MQAPHLTTKPASFCDSLRQNYAEITPKRKVIATIRQRSSVWRAEVTRNGIRKSASFNTKAEATVWATQVEADIMAGKRGAIPNKSFGDLLIRYRDEISVTKRGERWERVRIDRMVNGRPHDIPPIPADPLCAVMLTDLNATDFAAWRDRKLRQITPESVRREWTLLSHACTVAMREWCWLVENPLLTVRRPPPGKPRDRRISENEIERLLFALGYDYNEQPKTQTARVGAAFLFAIETAMRIGEIAAMRWSDVLIGERYLIITGEEAGAGKTKAARRQVPLSSDAIRILKQLEPFKKENNAVFQLSSTASVDALFRKGKARAQIEDLHFHDTRHEAITRLAKKLEVLDLARMVGHRDLRQLMVYYNETASEMAAKLD